MSAVLLLDPMRSCARCRFGHVRDDGYMLGCREFPCTGIAPRHFDAVLAVFDDPASELAAICDAYEPVCGPIVDDDDEECPANG